SDDRLLYTTAASSCSGVATQNTHDANGNLTCHAADHASSTACAEQPTARTFSYDLNNRAVSATTDAGTRTHSYSPLGRRVSTSDSTAARTYHWDPTFGPAQLALERHGSALHRVFTYGNGRISGTDGTAKYY